ncbi:MAG TPA: hypothetical protein VLB09_03975, partial [Nitrospiria bacterium]|nr:hypothetical protein [Nitrospiria bacterium]
RVVVSGRVRDISLQKGRRGGNYIVIRLESLKNNPKETHPVVKVFSLTPAPVLRGHEALVQGKYFVRGRAAGLPFENFIQADAIMREPAPQNQG